MRDVAKARWTVFILGLWFPLCCGFLVFRFWNRPQIVEGAGMAEVRDDYDRKTVGDTMALIIVGSVGVTFAFNKILYRDRPLSN